MPKPKTAVHLVGGSVKIFRESVRSEETWRQYERNLIRFLRGLGLGTDADAFLEHPQTR